MRKFAFENGKYYHVYNRGVDKRNIHLNDQDYSKFLNNLKKFNNDLNYNELRCPQMRRSGHCDRTANIVEIATYCLLPNHYHLLIRQLQDKGISKFIKKVSQSYTLLFNQKYNRSGVLYQGKFQAAPITDEHHLLKLSCYINGNPEIHNIANADQWPWSSYQNYLSYNNKDIAKPAIILKDVKNADEYKALTKHVISETKLERSGRSDRTAYMNYEPN